MKNKQKKTSEPTFESTLKSITFKQMNHFEGKTYFELMEEIFHKIHQITFKFEEPTMIVMHPDCVKFISDECSNQIQNFKYDIKKELFIMGIKVFRTIDVKPKEIIVK